MDTVGPELDRYDLGFLDDQRILGAGSGPPRVHGQVEVRKRQYDTVVCHASDALEMLWKGYCLRMRVWIDRVGPDVPELRLLDEGLTAFLEHPDRYELAIYKQWDIARHSVNTVLYNRCPLGRFPAVSVVYIHRLDLIEHLVGTPPGKHVCQSGGVSHADQGRYAGLFSTVVQREHRLGCIKIVAYIHVVYTRLDHGPEDRRAEPVEGADAVDHHRGAFDNLPDARLVLHVYRGSFNSLRVKRLRHLARCVIPFFRHDDLVEEIT